uniref:Peptidase S1 domain-containing protein n=1 Tax=Megaselia scalaris TaxID=36166 RepID=T1H0N0_MEGSC
IHVHDESEGKEYEADELLQHEDFDHKTLQNDVALIHVPEDIEYDENTAPIKLPSRNESYVGKNYTISGFGHMGKDKPLANTLQYTQLRVIPDQRCQRLYNHENFDGTKICALGRNGRSTCSGDSGGPLANAAKNYQIGIVSFGKGSCDGRNPSGYTKVSRYVNWIKEKTGMN